MINESRVTNYELRILIAGGGTGGHLFPAIAVAEEIASSHPEAKVVFAGTARGLEARIIPLTMWELVTMDVPVFKGMGWVRKMLTVLSMPAAIFRSLKILRKIRPDIVVSVGGYAAGPLTLCAALTGRATAAMEQNAIPGVTNRMLGRFVKRVFVAFQESAGYFSAGKVIVSGNPVRRKIKEAAAHKPVKRHGFTLFIFGGSQGAKRINEVMMESLKHLTDLKDDINIIHQIGRTEETERYLAIYRARGFKAEVYHFIEDMGRIYSTADLVICRAGATSIAELSVTGRPAILIPYPFAADNHQEANAKAVVSAGGAEMILDEELTDEGLASVVKRLLDDPLKLASMSEAMKRFGRPEAARVIVEECMKLVR